MYGIVDWKSRNCVLWFYVRYLGENSSLWDSSFPLGVGFGDTVPLLLLRHCPWTWTAVVLASCRDEDPYGRRYLVIQVGVVAVWGWGCDGPSRFTNRLRYRTSCLKLRDPGAREVNRHVQFAGLPWMAIVFLQSRILCVVCSNTHV